jgi:hypothetical protein
MCMNIRHRPLLAVSAGLLSAGLLLAGGPALPAVAAVARAGQAGIAGQAGLAGQAGATRARLAATAQSPIATTNGKVDALAYARKVVYAGGQFTRMKFRGQTYRRFHLGAVSARSGAPIRFSPRVNGEVTSLAVSPDGKVLYIGGSFTRVGTHPRLNVAAFNLVTGKLTSFAPQVVAGSVRAIAVTSGGVYLGGTITRVNGQPRTFAAEVTKDGVVTAWAPELDGWVRAMLVSPFGRRIFLGGGFHEVNGVRFEALAAVSLRTGADEQFSDGLIPTYPHAKKGKNSQVTSLTTDGRLIFAGAEGTGWHAFDGTLAFRPDSGRLVWRNTCLGATQAVLYLRGVLYKASHAHNCASAGGFGQIPEGWQAHHLLAESPASGRLLAWGTSADVRPKPVPDTNGGDLNRLGPFAFATDGSQLFVGGEFTKVNGRRQEGLARFGA